LCGRTDLDVLVRRDHAGAFRDVVARHGFKPFAAQPYATCPGMEHMLGFDPGSGSLVHLHVHFQLVLGERYVKNYRLRIERELLDSTRRLHGVPVPIAPDELAILCIRSLLKYRARDAVKDVLRIRSPGLPDPLIEEIGWLLTQTSVAEAGLALDRLLGPAAGRIGRRFLQITEHDRRSGATLLRLRGQVRSLLRQDRRMGRVRATTTYVRAVWRRRRHLRTRPLDNGLRSPAGGVAIALVGADGAGKSTLVSAISSWLGWRLIARTYYMGSKEPSLTSRWTYLAFRILRRQTRALERHRAGTGPARVTAAGRDALLALHYLSIGRDRSRRYEAARADVLEGRIVVFDRFPFETVSDAPDHRLLDGPQIASVLPSPRSALIRRLARAEERMYRRFRLPDELIALQVSLPVSVGRKPDHDPAILARKGRALTELAAIADLAPETIVTSIDADRPLNDVLLAIQSRVWDVL
jgi:hypothetical protein